MKTAWLKDHAVLYVARLSRASRLLVRLDYFTRAPVASYV